MVLGQHCTRTERRAEAAERELIRVKLLSYLEDQVGKAFHAIIVGVEDFGLFCRLSELPVEGLIHVTSLADDYYYLESGTHTLVGRRSGRRHRLGDREIVRIAPRRRGPPRAGPRPGGLTRFAGAAGAREVRDHILGPSCQTGPAGRRPGRAELEHAAEMPAQTHNDEKAPRKKRAPPKPRSRQRRNGARREQSSSLQNARSTRTSIAGPANPPVRLGSVRSSDRSVEIESMVRQNT